MFFWSAQFLRMESAVVPARLEVCDVITPFAGFCTLGRRLLSRWRPRVDAACRWAPWPPSCGYDSRHVHPPLFVGFLALGRRPLRWRSCRQLPPAGGLLGLDFMLFALQ